MNIKSNKIVLLVILMDSLENTMIQTAINDSKTKPQLTNNNLGRSKKVLKVQISEERIEHEINNTKNNDNQLSYEEDYEQDDDDDIE